MKIKSSQFTFRYGEKIEVRTIGPNRQIVVTDEEGGQISITLNSEQFNRFVLWIETQKITEDE